jgi:hypothetical protein
LKYPTAESTSRPRNSEAANNPARSNSASVNDETRFSAFFHTDLGADPKPATSTGLDCEY